MGFGLALVLHPLLGHQQDHSHSHQTAANDVEDRGAHAARGGQGGAGVVDDVNTCRGFLNPLVVCFTQVRRNIFTLNGKFKCLFQLIVAFGGFNFFQVVGRCSFQAFDRQCAACIGLNRLDCCFSRCCNTIGIVSICYQFDFSFAIFVIVQFELCASQQCSIAVGFYKIKAIAIGCGFACDRVKFEET